MPSFEDDLNVSGKIRTGLGFVNAGTVTFYPPDGWAWFHIDNGPEGGRPTGRLRISGGEKPGEHEMFSITQDGNVGIGTTTPRARLEVNGDIIATGDVILQNADCAEDFDAVGPGAVEPGTVMVLNDDGQLVPSWRAYDTRVAGVVSGAGNFKPAVVLDRHPGRPNRVPIALVGKVYCRVDADPSSIRVGDLLTTAHRPGYAMKALDCGRAFGAVLGKALRPLAFGRAHMPILVALQ